MIPTPWWSYLYRSSSMGELRNTPLRLKRDEYMGQVILIYIRWIVNLISQIWGAWCHAMASWQIMAEVSAQSWHICSGVQDCEHQWSHLLCWHYWFVVIVVWVVVGLGGVSPPFELKPMVENNLGALRCVPCAYANEYLFVHLVHNTSSVALQQCFPASWGLWNLCGQHMKDSGMAGVACYDKHIFLIL